MQIIIDIPESAHEACKVTKDIQSNGITLGDILIGAVAKGVILQKGLDKKRLNMNKKNALERIDRMIIIAENENTLAEDAYPEEDIEALKIAYNCIFQISEMEGE